MAPFLGEVLSTATPPLDLLLPWKFALLAALYGCGALVCREIAHRRGLGLRGLLLLGAAYGVYEEALVDRFWFEPSYWEDTGVGTYSEVWGINVLLAVHLTLFHVAVSIGATVLLVERTFPAWQDRPWAGRSGLTLAGLALIVVVPLTYGELGRGPLGPQLAALVLCAALIFLALRCRPRPAPLVPIGARLGLTAFVATAAHFLLVYSVPSFGVPWPAGLAIALVPVAGGVLVVRRTTPTLEGPASLRVLVGILAFFALLDVLVGLGGRPDLSLAGIAVAIGLHRLRRGLHPAGLPADTVPEPRVAAGG